MTLSLEGRMQVLCIEIDKANQLSMVKIEQGLREANMEGTYTMFAKLGMVRCTGCTSR